MTQFVTKRIYDPAEADDGYRVLVDRLWSRGVSKERAALDEWAKDISPSTELRQWYGRDPAKFQEFTRRYQDELKANANASTIFANWHTHDRVTLLYGARSDDNEAVVLCSYLALVRQ
ncbi:MAG TPA: DUF488 family protein [Candidatus Saccharibacteria bacterium]|nr:DUF488 family protein [Candidatus Saccharibacteria bacterium]